MTQNIILKIVVLAVLGVGGFFLLNQNDKGKNEARDTTDIIDTTQNAQTAGFGVGQKVTLYKSPTCGCCVGYAEELEKQGFEVETVVIEDMNEIKEKYGIPQDKQSCHTMTIGDYFIEGHTPMEAVEKLLTEKPDIAGIGLPRMPSGTPGMPGPKRAPYEVYQSVNGVFSEFLTI